MPQYPQQPQQGYPAPQPAYPPQHYPQPAPQYPPQGYGQPQYAPPAPQPPAQPLPAGSLDTFYSQPSASGGPSFKFKDKPIGTYYEGFVARQITDGDVRPQTDRDGKVSTYRDGRPKFVLVVPMTVQPTQEFPEGTAGWWVKGQARDELARAMDEAGAPKGAPEAGAWIRVTLVGQRQIPGGFNPQFQYRVEYRRPQGATPPVPMAVQATDDAIAAGASAPWGPGEREALMAKAAQQVQQPVTAQQVQQPAPAPVAAPVPQPAPQQAPTPQAPAGMSPEQLALFAKLTGQSAS
jgi:hypothetical protein